MYLENKWYREMREVKKNYFANEFLRCCQKFAMLST